MLPTAAPSESQGTLHTVASYNDPISTPGLKLHYRPSHTDLGQGTLHTVASYNNPISTPGLQLHYRPSHTDLGQGTLHTVASYNNPISTPGLQLHYRPSHTDLGQGTLHTVASYNDPIPLVGAPGLKQLPGQSALHHSRAGHDDTRSHVIKLVYTLEVGYVFEHKRIGYSNLPSNVLVHGSDVGLIHSHAFLRQRGSVVNGDVV
jgi:hypothetical protein